MNYGFLLVYNTLKTLIIGLSLVISYLIFVHDEFYGNARYTISMFIILLAIFAILDIRITNVFREQVSITMENNYDTANNQPV